MEPGEVSVNYVWAFKPACVNQGRQHDEPDEREGAHSRFSPARLVEGMADHYETTDRLFRCVCPPETAA